jgi:hypothetical protein
MRVTLLALRSLQAWDGPAADGVLKVKMRAHKSNHAVVSLR